MANHAIDSPKRYEHYPLLKVGGGGDGARPPLGVLTKTPRRTWSDRWPEILSACWMTVVLLCICFLTLYVLGVALTKRQALVIQYMKNHENHHERIEQHNDVFYHHVVPYGAPIEFVVYSSYLSKMAILYPHLQFNVYFLIDDSVHSVSMRSKRSRIFRFIAPSSIAEANSKMDDVNTREFKSFLRRHPNVNATIMSLSQYMATTPLKYKWRGLPGSWLNFYARVYSVWQNGGIGVDLLSSNADHLTRQKSDPRKTVIFKNYNDGHYDNSQNPSGCTQSAVDDDFPMLLYVLKFFMTQMMDQTMMFNNSTLITSPISEHERNKRDIEETTSKSFVYNVTNSSGVEELSNVDININDTYVPVTSKPKMNSTWFIFNDSITTIKSEEKDAKNIAPNVRLAKTKAMRRFGTPSIPQNRTEFTPSGSLGLSAPIWFYRISVLTDETVPTYNSFSNPTSYVNNQRFSVNDIRKKSDINKNILTLDAEGKFISTFSRFHPLLGHIISSGFRRMAPRFAIEDALRAHCSTFIRNDDYCKNIIII